MVILRVGLSVFLVLFIIFLVFSPLLFSDTYTKMIYLLKSKIIKEDYDSEPEITPEEKAYQEKHDALVKECYDKLGEELGLDETTSQEPPVNDNPPVNVNIETEDDRVKRLLEGIVPAGVIYDEEHIRQYLWEMKQAADVNEDVLRRHLGWRVRR